MGLIDDAFASDMAAFCDADTIPGAESVSYTPSGGSLRTIKVNIDREHPEDVADSTAGAGAFIRFFVQRHATLGTTSIDKDGDAFSVAPRYGGTARTFKIVSVIGSDAGGWTLRLRGPAN